MVPVIILIGLIGVPGIIGAPTGEVSRENVLRKFQKIRDECLRYRDDLNQKKNLKYNQILCILVMSGIEVDSEAQFPKNRMTKVLNTDSNRRPGIPEFYGKKIHGEIIVLDLDNVIPDLIKVFDRESKTAGQGLPYVFVYSYYIPCADVTNTRFSCAEELAMHARLHQDSFNMLVGYSVIFPGTNSDLANSYLHQRGMFALVNLHSNAVDMGTETSFTIPGTDIFQKRFHDCILNNDVFCNCRGCSRKKDTVARDQINALVHECTANRINERGPLTHLSLWKMEECFNNAGWTTCCERKQENERHEVRHCFLDIMKSKYADPNTLLVFGIPVNRQGKPYWTPSDIAMDWNRVYKHYHPPQTASPLHIAYRFNMRQKTFDQNEMERKRNAIIYELIDARRRKPSKPSTLNICKKYT